MPEDGRTVGRSGERAAANVDRDSVTLKVAVNGRGRYGTLGRMCLDCEYAAQGSLETARHEIFSSPKMRASVSFFHIHCSNSEIS